MRSLKKKAVWVLLIMVIVLGLITLVGINRITDDNTRNSYSYNMMMKGLAKFNNNSLIKEVNNDNVTTTYSTVTQVGDDDLSPQPAAAAPVTWEGKRNKIMKAEGSKEEAEEPFRITQGIYGLIMGVMTSFFGYFTGVDNVSWATRVKHVAAFSLSWLVNLMIAIVVLSQNEGKFLATGWYYAMELIFCITFIAMPVIFVHFLIAETYTWGGVLARIGIMRGSRAQRSCSEEARQYFIQQVQRLLVDPITHGLDEDNLC